MFSNYSNKLPNFAQFGELNEIQCRKSFSRKMSIIFSTKICLILICVPFKKLNYFQGSTIIVSFLSVLNSSLEQDAENAGDDEPAGSKWISITPEKPTAVKSKDMTRDHYDPMSPTKEELVTFKFENLTTYFEN